MTNNLVGRRRVFPLVAIRAPEMAVEEKRHQHAPITHHADHACTIGRRDHWGQGRQAQPVPGPGHRRGGCHAVGSRPVRATRRDRHVVGGGHHVRHRHYRIGALQPFDETGGTGHPPARSPGHPRLQPTAGAQDQGAAAVATAPPAGAAHRGRAYVGAEPGHLDPRRARRRGIGRPAVGPRRGRPIDHRWGQSTTFHPHRQPVFSQPCPADQLGDLLDRPDPDSDDVGKPVGQSLG